MRTRNPTRRQEKKQDTSKREQVSFMQISSYNISKPYLKHDKQVVHIIKENKDELTGHMKS